MPSLGSLKPRAADSLRPTLLEYMYDLAQPTSTPPVFNARKTKETHNLKPHPVTGRLIDSHPGARTRPMRVLMLGMSRTGTMSLFTALTQLGYKPYHISNLDVWRQGLNVKFNGVGKPWGREEFDKILGEYDAVADVPCICFAEELVKAYPEAKVVLSMRDVDSWLGSMASSAAFLGACEDCYAGFFFDDFSSTSPARGAFERHYEHVRGLVPKERLLEFRVQEGWGPLCGFLGHEVPQGEFPRINDKRAFVFAHGVIWWMAFGKMVVKTGWIWGPVVLGGVGWWSGWLRNDM
ncbi:hypothetical protein CLAFUW4_00150 [Fulvia fulva]|uniref:NAD dependent epimerase/dehydratase n=1 Tax=Passalora fulva TaxID=5499 RepID=A0A9Q8L6W7_PASFU|nr:uncharacterized protein CLAFUR5_00148 [Fulvia fulva]KAK4634603.1 hypothetical protein CLAFUR4_00150 [Fulvia fulva]KAK4636362.1 hypothetical protein CLAFUR0_00148 [Fulvia fulva]UJO11318.1 hypothetical protein CLAFUR5_00148 [Fulvia fulva]WPV10140.1 hypothetical protein CLAFUW4_00150 [Fulvia fulva]WPV24077.1 hypothetical protein CLAFUW7_00150 [Fulvia fulva]